ncbi:MAG: thiamine-monophosphate kinase [Verrucomicrobia bacterium]|nr:thiamine-monophosphate kinase [Verrucomicrobiota bacterium]
MKWDGRYLVATTDFLNANPIALELGIGSIWDLGRLVVASNLSDLCGSGALPVALLVGVTLPQGATRSEFKEFMRGVKFEADRHRVPVIGGDSKLGKSRALLAVAIGSAQSRRQLFLKNGARPDDVIWVSGNLGSVAAAVWGYGRTDLTRHWKAWARKALLTPKLPLKASRRISASRLGHGGTDISDGFGADLYELCKASSVGAVVDVEMIPASQEVKQAAKAAGVRPWRFAFASGGDFQFIVTTGKSARAQMNRLGLHEVGEITKQRHLDLRLPDGAMANLPTKGHRDRRRLTFAEEIDTLIKTPTTSRLGN